MKIAILGANGFIGRNVAAYLGCFHQVSLVTRSVLNLLDGISVREFLSSNRFDVVVNCAASMNHSDGISDAINNFGTFMNFYDNKKYFSKYINMASGAEYDRSRTMNNVCEEELFERMPSDSYGWSQNMKSRLCAQTKGFYNIRIFNCFGRGEISTRIFPRLLQQNYIEIDNDRYFDYFSIQDLVRVVKNCVENEWAIADVNACYENKYLISQVIKKFCDLNNLDFKIIINSIGGNNYTGSAVRLNSLSIPLMGLNYGLKNYNFKNL